MRLNRYLATATGISRRAADELIATGNVLINGNVTQVGHQVTDSDNITIDGKLIELPKGSLYLVLNKPVGYVTSRLQQGNTPTIYNLLPEQYHRLKSVGRLDKDTSGLILLTDDGDTAFALTHPSQIKLKVYEVVLNRDLTARELALLTKGVELDDGVSRFDSVEGSGKHLTVTLHEGRNRQIRRTFTALGARVEQLHRTKFGNLTLDGLKIGSFRLIDKSEL